VSDRSVARATDAMWSSNPPDAPLGAGLVFGQDGVRRLRKEWDALFARADNPLASQGFEWNDTAWTSLVMPRGGTPCCVVVRQHEGLRLVWPLAILRHHRAWRLAVAPAISECGDPLIEAGEDQAALAKAACDALWRHSGADLVYADFLRAGSPLHAALSARAPFFSQDLESFATDWHDTPGWTDYETGLSKRLRSQVEASRRQLAALGTLRVEQVTGAAELERTIRWIVETKERWLATKGRHSSFVGQPGFQDFLTQAARRMEPSGSAVVFRLTLDDQLVAAEFHLLGPAQLDYVIGAFAPDQEKHRPGQLLRLHSLRWAHERRVPLNFGPGRDRYKAALANTITRFADLRCAISLRGRLFARLKALRSVGHAGAGTSAGSVQP